MNVWEHPQGDNPAHEVGLLCDVELGRIAPAEAFTETPLQESPGVHATQKRLTWSRR